MFLSRENIEGERCMSAEGSSVKSSTSFPKVKGGGPLFSGPGPLITGGLVNDTSPAVLYSVHYDFSSATRVAMAALIFHGQFLW